MSDALFYIRTMGVQKVEYRFIATLLCAEIECYSCFILIGYAENWDSGIASRIVSSGGCGMKKWAFFG